MNKPSIWNQQKQKSYKLKVQNQISKAIESFKNPSGQIKLKWIPKKNGSSKENSSKVKINPNAEP